MEWLGGDMARRDCAQLAVPNFYWEGEGEKKIVCGWVFLDE